MVVGQGVLTLGILGAGTGWEEGAQVGKVFGDVGSHLPLELNEDVGQKCAQNIGLVSASFRAFGPPGF